MLSQQIRDEPRYLDSPNVRYVTRMRCAAVLRKKTVNWLEEANGQRYKARLYPVDVRRLAAGDYE